MATLPSTAIDEIWSQVMQEFSAQRTEIPSAISKSQLRAGIVNIDTELESAEISIFQGISNADVKSWLQANQTVGRRIIELTAKKRREEI